MLTQRRTFGVILILLLVLVVLTAVWAFVSLRDVATQALLKQRVDQASAEIELRESKLGLDSVQNLQLLHWSCLHLHYIALLRFSIQLSSPANHPDQARSNGSCDNACKTRQQ